LYLIFDVSYFLKVDNFATFSECPKAKSVSASGGRALPPDLLTRSSASGPRWGLCPQTPLCLGSFQLSNAGTGQTPVYTARTTDIETVVRRAVCLFTFFLLLVLITQCRDGQAELTWMAGYVMRRLKPTRYQLSKPSN